MVITTYEGRHAHSPSLDLEESQAPSQLNNFFFQHVKRSHLNLASANGVHGVFFDGARTWKKQESDVGAGRVSQAACNLCLINK